MDNNRWIQLYFNQHNNSLSMNKTNLYHYWLFVSSISFFRIEKFFSANTYHSGNITKSHRYTQLVHNSSLTSVSPLVTNPNYLLTTNINMTKIVSDYLLVLADFFCHLFQYSIPSFLSIQI